MFSRFLETIHITSTPKSCVLHLAVSRHGRLGCRVVKALLLQDAVERTELSSRLAMVGNLTSMCSTDALQVWNGSQSEPF